MMRNCRIDVETDYRI